MTTNIARAESTSTTAASRNAVPGIDRASDPTAVEDSLRILVVAFHFPPIAAAGTHRTLNFVRQLDAQGHRIGVVTTRATAGFRVEESSLSRIPASVTVRRAWHVDPFLALHRMRGGAAPAEGVAGAEGPAGSVARVAGERGLFGRSIDYLTRLLDVPDRYASWILPAVAQGIWLAADLKPQVIYSTAPPFSAHLAALLLADTLGLPLVVDLRDPWAVNPFRSVPFESLRELDRWLESQVIARARRVILNTPLAEREYVERYREPEKFITIQNGISPDLFTLPRAEPQPGAAFRLVHVGSIYGRRSPLPLVRALARIAATRPEIAERIAIEQIGPVEDGGALVGELARCGIASRFVIRPAVSHREAFLETTKAHALLLLGVSGERPEVQVPAKLFEYLVAARPILALAKTGGAILATLDRAGARYVAADPDDSAAIERALLSLVESGAADRPSSNGVVHAPGSDPAAAFRYEHLARDLATVLRDAVGGARDA